MIDVFTLIAGLVFTIAVACLALDVGRSLGRSRRASRARARARGRER